MVAAAGRSLFSRPNCLERSLALWWLLRLRGLAADLRLGARKEGTRFEAHAWVELDGSALSDVGEVQIQFMPFESPVAVRKAQTH